MDPDTAGNLSFGNCNSYIPENIMLARKIISSFPFNSIWLEPNVSNLSL